MSDGTEITVSLTHDEFMYLANAVANWRQVLQEVPNPQQSRTLEGAWQRIRAAYWDDSE